MFERISQGLYWNRLLRLTDGCTPCSPGCTRCWSARYCHRFPRYSGLTHTLIENPAHREITFNGKIRLNQYNLDLPLRTKKPQAWLILNDLAHEEVTWGFFGSVIGRIAESPKHIFLLLTKRPDRLKGFMDGMCHQWRALPNLWLGVTVCNQQEANEKIPILLQIPAAVRFVSIEPMLGPVSLSKWMHPETDETANLCFDKGIACVILGGESGPGARPMYPDWVRSVQKQCQATGVPFFFKQWGEWVAAYKDERVGPDGNPEMFRIGKKAAGRLLDGKEYSELPRNIGE